DGIARGQSLRRQRVREGLPGGEAVPRREDRTDLRRHVQPSAADDRETTSRVTPRPAPSLLEHSWPDLHSDRNDVVHGKAGAAGVLPARIRVRRLELAERVFAVGGEMTANPLQTWHFLADLDDPLADSVQLFGR